MAFSDSKQTHWFAQDVHLHEVALRADLRSRFPTLPDIDGLVQERSLCNSESPSTSEATFS